MSRRANRYDVVVYAPMLAPLLATNDVGATGGGETQLLLVARLLAAQGLRVCLAAYDSPGAEIPRTIDGVEIALRPVYRRGGTLKRVRELVGLVRHLAALDGSVYLTRIASYHVGAVGLAARLRRRRFVYSSAHVTDFDFAQISPTRRDYLLFRLGLALAHTLVVQTQEQVDLSRAKLRREPVLIPNVVEPAEPRAGVGDAFLWLGRACWYKAPLAYLELARALPEARFLAVATPVPDEPALFDEVRTAAAELPNVELLEPRPRRELAPLYRRAVATVNTSRFEGMSNVILEGWAHGVPALVLEHDPDGLVAAKGLGAFADGSWDAFVAAARDLWERRADPDELAARCRDHVARLGPDAVAPRWLEVLAIVTAHPGAELPEPA